MTLFEEKKTMLVFICQYENVDPMFCYSIGFML